MYVYVDVDVLEGRRERERERGACAQEGKERKRISKITGTCRSTEKQSAADKTDKTTA
jgi:hypothetical protein